MKNNKNLLTTIGKETTRAAIGTVGFTAGLLAAGAVLKAPGSTKVKAVTALTVGAVVSTAIYSGGEMARQKVAKKISNQKHQKLCLEESLPPRKYELTKDNVIITPDGVTLYRIKSLMDFTTIDGEEIHSGDLGGYVQSELNLAHRDKCWISDEAAVLDDAAVIGNAVIYGNAVISENAKIGGNSVVSGNAKVFGDALIMGNTVIYGDAKVYGDAYITDKATIYGNAKVFGKAEIGGNSVVSGNAKVFGKAKISGNSVISGTTEISGNTEISGDD